MSKDRNRNNRLGSRPRRSSHDPRGIFSTAECFFKSSAALKVYADTRSGPPYISVHEAGVPGLVCSAFAMELYLKCLITLQLGDAPEIHDLEELFKELPAESQEIIRQGYLRRIQPDLKSHSAFRDQMRSQGVHVPNPEDFDALLKSSARAFESFRYIYDRNLTNRTPAFLIGDALFAMRGLILSYHPDWEPGFSSRVIVPTGG